MNTKEMFVLDQEVVDKIDENRGNLSKSEFIKFCIDTILESMPPDEYEKERKRPVEKLAVTRQVITDYATREEFEVYKRSVQELMRYFFELFITFLGPSGYTEEPYNLQNQLDRILAEH